ncbi:MAG TPA: hypothetical protein VH951_10440 [Dehalococcoidia bacterium]
MVNPWHLLAIFFAAAIAFAVSVTYVLVIDAKGPQLDEATTRQWTFPPDRTDCNQIYGTAYRSDAERKWFNDNCSAWSQNVGSYADPTAAPSGAPAAQTAPQQTSAPGPDGRDCNQVRGTPYRSEAERAWYVASCANNNAAAAPSGVQTAAASGPDRTDCNQIRGTAYRSDTERSWYLSHCQQPQQAAQPTPAPVRPQQVAPQPQAPIQPPNNGNGNGNGNGNQGRR